jgi:glucans biosynthesis protein C
MSDATRQPSRPPSRRLAYLDWLRFLVVLLLTPFHAAISFTGMGVVYVYDAPVRDAILAGTNRGLLGPEAMRTFTVFMDNWFMSLLFFVSGIGAAIALKKRSPGSFLGERAQRLLLPLFLGCILVIPIQSWFRAYSFGRFEGGLLAFFPVFLNIANGGYFEWGHLWFLIYLFTFSVIALPLFGRLAKDPAAGRLARVSSTFSKGAWILLPALWFAGLEAGFRPGWPGSMTLVNDWAIFTLSLSFFVFGFVAGRNDCLLEAAERLRGPALALGLGAFVCRLAVYRVFQVHEGYDGANILTQAFRGLAAYFLVIAAIGYGRRYLDRESRALGVARDLAFPLYILHYAPLCGATYLLLGSGLSVWLRWGLAVAASWASVAAFTVLARYLPPLRSFFGIRKPGPR